MTEIAVIDAELAGFGTAAPLSSAGYAPIIFQKKAYHGGMAATILKMPAFSTGADMES